MAEVVVAAVAPVEALEGVAVEPVRAMRRWWAARSWVQRTSP